MYNAAVPVLIRDGEPYMDLELSVRGLSVRYHDSFVVGLRPDCFLACLLLQGTGIYPMLSFDRREVLLPVVPIGTTSTTTFFVLNNGYETMQVRAFGLFAYLA